MTPDPPVSSPPPAPQGTLTRWAWDYLSAERISSRFSLEPPPREDPLYEGPPLRDLRPERERPERADLHAGRAPRKLTAHALRDPTHRARLLHTFLHHELQAAELVCWALLAYPDAPRALRAGLARVALDEVRHMGLYAERLTALGFAYGDFPARDWFWERAPAAPSMAHFLATVGLGFEGANLDHAARIGRLFHEAGDAPSARLQELVQREEVPHVHLARTWFERLAGGFSAELFAAHLPPPLTPWVLRGTPMDRAARERAGLDARFNDALAAWTERGPGC